MIRMGPFTSEEKNILNYVEGKPIEREVHLLKYVQEEAEEEGKNNHVDHNLLGLGCEVELPFTVSCEKHCLNPKCKIFIQSDIISNVLRRPIRPKGLTPVFKVP